MFSGVSLGCYEAHIVGFEALIVARYDSWQDLAGFDVNVKYEYQYQLFEDSLLTSSVFF